MFGQGSHAGGRRLGGQNAAPVVALIPLRWTMRPPAGPGAGSTRNAGLKTVGRNTMRLEMKWPLFALGSGLFMCVSGANAVVNVRLEPYVTGVNAPMMMVQPEGDDRKFVVEQH